MPKSTGIQIVIRLYTCNKMDKVTLSTLMRIFHNTFIRINTMIDSWSDVLLFVVVMVVCSFIEAYLIGLMLSDNWKD